MRARLRTFGAALAALLLAGCATPTTGTDGFVTGDGSITVIAPDERQAAPVIVGETLDGAQWSSDSVGDKVIVYNVWGSWCVPCRAENHHVVKAYEKFRDKNFTVLGVSLERPGDRQAWVNAIIKDKLTWTHVAALTKEEGEMIRNLYTIQSIPMNFLIDPQGKIVAVYLRGEALMKKLEELL